MANNMGNIIGALLQRNPNVQKNPKAMEALQAVMTGDAEKGQAIAREICQANGANPQDATNQANAWFSGLFGGK